MTSLQSLTVDELLDEFDFLGDWEDRCDYLIDLGFELPPMAEELKTEANKVRGCQSNVWMVISTTDAGPPQVEITADSDAMIVKGLIAILLTIYNRQPPRVILETDIQNILKRLGLDRHLSTARKNGLSGMVKRIREYAAAAESQSV